MTDMVSMVAGWYRASAAFWGRKHITGTRETIRKEK